jgi:hypothetical protein
MLEINCSYWIDNYDLSDFSNSIANSGDPNIGCHTWENACEAILDGYKSKDASRQIITSTASRRMCIDYFQEFGAWSKPELKAMTNIELSALALQHIAGNYIECEAETGSHVAIEDCEQGWFYLHRDNTGRFGLWTTLSN